MSKPSPDSGYRTPGIDAAAPLPDIGTQRIETTRFSRPEFMQREWTQLWRKVWNIGPRLEEFSASGDYVVHELGKESFLFVRGEDGEIRGFYNVCQHRGSILVNSATCGRERFFQCPYHAWSYNLDGSIKGVPAADNFPQLQQEMDAGQLNLEALTIDTWGGFICFNLDPDCRPLSEFLGELPQQLAPYHIEDMRYLEYKTFLWDCNWKVACDAFNESYHFRGLHPQMLKWADEKARIELLGDHSRMINKYGTTSSPYRGGEELYPELREWMLYNGLDPAGYQGAPEDAWQAKVAQVRANAGQSGGPAAYAEMTDEQLTDVYHYFLFPGFAMNIFPEGINGFRFRPHPTDPCKMYYDLIMLVHYPPGHQQPCERKFFNEPVSYADVADAPISAIVTDVLQQDADNVAVNQKGLMSDGFRGLLLGEQELRVRHFHNVLDRYLGD